MNTEGTFRLSVVIPCFNEQEVIRATHQRLIQVLGDRPDFELELVYVNDGSIDQTESILCSLADEDSRANVISFARNFGHQPAVTAGLEHATGDAVAIIDADLQDPPEVILQMIGMWRQGFDVVYGVRAKRKEGLLKRLAYRSFYRIYRQLANIEVQLDSGDFALMDRRVVNVLNSLPEKNRFVRGLRAWAGFRQTACVYERAARAAGETKYSFAKLLRLAFDGIFNFSTAPLTLIFFIGLATSIAATLAGAIYLVARVGGFTLLGHRPEDVPGFTTLILTLLFFSGVQLISVGIVGEYLGRIYQETKMRPSYVIRAIRGSLAATAVAVNTQPLAARNASLQRHAGARMTREWLG
jgi:polyisoprenyl-phosphate glycosyltransferase